MTQYAPERPLLVQRQVDHGRREVVPGVPAVVGARQARLEAVVAADDEERPVRVRDLEKARRAGPEGTFFRVRSVFNAFL